LQAYFRDNCGPIYLMALRMICNTVARDSH
jgi:hypothetical protein